MARTRGGLNNDATPTINTFNNHRIDAAKEIASARTRNHQIKIKFLTFLNFLKRPGNIVRETTEGMQCILHDLGTENIN